MPAEPAIAAHRGGAALWPENSLTAIRNAAALAIAQIEVDVHLAADGVPMVIHDATLDRTTIGSGSVDALTADALRATALRGLPGEGVPMLVDVAQVVRNAGKLLRMEIKTNAAGRPYPGAVAACAAVLDATGMRDRTIVISFAPYVVAEAVDAGFPDVALLFGAAAWRGMSPPLAGVLCRASGAGEIGLPFSECDKPESVAAIRATGLRLGAWGVDDASAIARARALGLDVITTDDPKAALIR